MGARRVVQNVARRKTIFAVDRFGVAQRLRFSLRVMRMKRAAEMKRSEFKRATPMARTAKPATGKPRVRTCRSCKAKFEPRTQMQIACGVPCAIAHGAKITATQKAKQQRKERVQDKARLDSFKTYPQLIAACQKAFNALVRYRDKDQPCICCGRRSEKEFLTGSNWDCGHYRSTGSAPHLRFNFDNAHRQMVFCNRHGAGRAVDYRIGLIARIGLVRVEALEADNTPRKWTHDELRAMTAEYRAKLAALKKQIDIMETL